MTRLFGTDGVRGLANASLTAELALDLSVCAAHVLADRGESIVLEPAELRPVVAKRAAQLLRELKLSRVRVPS